MVGCLVAGVGCIELVYYFVFSYGFYRQGIFKTEVTPVPRKPIVWCVPFLLHLELKFASVVKRKIFEYINSTVDGNHYNSYP